MPRRAAQEQPLAAEVKRILSPVLPAFDERKAAAALLNLGPDALPLVVAEVPRLAGARLSAAALALARARYAPAAPVLAQRLQESPKNLPLLRALRWIPGGPEAMTPNVIGAVAEIANHLAWDRTLGFALLADIGTPAALAVVDAILSPLEREWRSSPVSPGPPGRDALHPAARVSLSSGGMLLVYAGQQLGNESDLWAVELNPAGELAGPARFLGASIRGCRWTCPLSARLDGTKLAITGLDSRHTVRVDLESVSRDSDSDGLPDLVEPRMGTDPRRPDSDGDGIDDGRDPVPNAASRAPIGEREEIVEAIYRQLALLEGPSELTAVVDEAPLRWYGGKGPTLAFSSHQAADSHARRTRATYLRRVWIEPLSPSLLDDFLARDPYLRPPDPDERAYQIINSRGVPLSSGVSRVIVRRLAGRWLIRDVFGTMAS